MPNLKVKSNLEEIRKYKDIDDYMFNLKEKICQAETMLSMLIWKCLCITLIVNTLILDLLQKIIDDKPLNPYAIC